MGQVAGGRDLLSAGLKGIAWPYFLCAFFLIADKLVMYPPPPPALWSWQLCWWTAYSHSLSKTESFLFQMASTQVSRITTTKQKFRVGFSSVYNILQSYFEWLKSPACKDGVWTLCLAPSRATFQGEELVSVCGLGSACSSCALPRWLLSVFFRKEGTCLV